MVKKKYMNLFVNNESIIFLDIDKANNYHTIAYNWQTDEIIAIRPKEYHLLRFIWEQNGLTGSEADAYRSIYIRNQEEALSLIKKLLDRKLLYTKNG